jgi:hypothetical protein
VQRHSGAAVQRRSAPGHRPAAPPLARAAGSKASTATSRRPACGCSRPPARASSPGAPGAAFSARSRLRLPQAPTSLGPSAAPGGNGWPRRPCFRHRSSPADPRAVEQRTSRARLSAPAIICARGCSRMWRGLQPRVPEAATMCQRLRRHEFERARRTSFATPTFAPHFSSAASAQLACEPKLRCLRVLGYSAPVVRGASLPQGRRDGASQRQRRLVRIQQHVAPAASKVGQSGSTEHLSARSHCMQTSDRGRGK